jgi:rhodanese-related sulfurtransferase
MTEMTDSATEQPIRGISVSEARAQVADGSVQVVDIRPPFDFAGGHIPRALSLPGLALRTRAAQLAHDRGLLIVDADGSQADDACAEAVSLGFTAVNRLEGGFEAWLAAGYPIHTISDSMA